MEEVKGGASNPRIDKELRNMFKYVKGEPIVYFKNGVGIKFFMPDDYPFAEPFVIVDGYQAIQTKSWSPASTMLDIWNDYLNQRAFKTAEEALAYANSDACKSGFAFIPLGH